MKPDTSLMNKTGALMLLLVFGSIPLVATAACTFASGNTKGTITIDPGVTTLTVPRDKTGSLFVSPFTSAATNVRFSCNTADATNQAGVNNSSGTQPLANIASFAIGTTGLFWRWRIKASATATAGLRFSFGSRSSGVPGNTNNSTDGETYAWELFSNGPIAAGTIIPAGTYGTYRVGTLDVLEIKLLNAITIGSTTCTTPDVVVPMPSHKTSDFPAAGTGPSTRSRTGYALAINDCPEQVSAVRFQFNVDASRIIDSVNGVIKLSNPDATATAQGVGLQLRDDTGTPLKFNEFIPFTGFVQATAGTTRSHRVNFDAGYFKTRTAAVTPGAANSTMTFTMLYQ